MNHTSPFRRLCSPQTAKLLDTLRQGTEHLRAMAEKSDDYWDTSSSDPRRLHNNYARNLVTCYSAKMADLSEATLSALESLNYLTYALCGRAMLETTATLRYYVVHEYLPLLSKGPLNAKDARKLIEIDDQHLRGTKFDWESFLFRNYEKLVENARVGTRKGGSKKRPPGPPSGILAASQPVRVGTCIENWAEEQPGALVAYNLFCDLVHPNMGSTFLVASTNAGKLYFTKSKGQPTGHQIFEQTLPILLSVTHKPFGEYLLKLAATIWQDDELP